MLNHPFNINLILIYKNSKNNLLLIYNSKNNLLLKQKFKFNINNQLYIRVLVLFKRVFFLSKNL